MMTSTTKVEYYLLNARMSRYWTDLIYLLVNMIWGCIRAYKIYKSLRPKE